MSNSLATSLLSKFTTVTEATASQDDTKAYRTVLGNVYIQPTGVTKPNPTDKKKKVLQPESSWKFHYVYLGFTDSSGKSIAGFSIDSRKMLELVELKVLDISVAKAFEAYANVWVPKGKAVIVA